MFCALPIGWYRVGRGEGDLLRPQPLMIFPKTKNFRKSGKFSAPHTDLGLKIDFWWETLFLENKASFDSYSWDVNQLILLKIMYA